jgi:hypothetical protein
MQHDSNGKLNLAGYTTCKLILDDRLVTLCATSKYGFDGQWYDWCLVAWQDFEETYPARELGFFDFNLPGVEQNCKETPVYAVLQSSSECSPILMEIMSEQFVPKYHMPEDLDECTYSVPIKSIVHPLNVFPNFDRPNREYFCTLPQRNGFITLATKSNNIINTIFSDFFHCNNLFNNHCFMVVPLWQPPNRDM